MRVTTRMIGHMDEGESYSQTDTPMKVSGTKEKHMVKVCTEQFKGGTMEIGTWMFKKALAKRLGKTGLSMKGSIKMATSME